MPETQNIEYKTSWRDEYLKWICDFANASGGSIFIGKNDAGKVAGVANAKKLLEDIPNKAKNTLGILVDGQYQEINGISKKTATYELTELVEKYKLLIKTGVHGAGVSYKIIGQ